MNKNWNIIFFWINEVWGNYKDFIIVFEDNFVLINCEHGEILLFHVEKRMIFVTVDSLFYMNT